MERALPRELVRWPFAVCEALAADVQPSRLRRKDVAVPFRGAHVGRLTAMLTVRELVALGDAIIHWRSPRSTLGELRAGFRCPT